MKYIYDKNTKKWTLDGEGEVLDFVYPKDEFDSGIFCNQLWDMALKNTERLQSFYIKRNGQ